MRICILTQKDPFYLAENIDYLLKNLPKGSEIVSCIVFDVSPFGKKESFVEKTKKTLDIFGVGFFAYYTFKFIKNRLNPSKDVEKVLKKNKVPVIKLDTSVNSAKSLDIIARDKPDLLISIAGNQIFREKL